MGTPEFGLTPPKLPPEFKIPEWKTLENVEDPEAAGKSKIMKEKDSVSDGLSRSKKQEKTSKIGFGFDEEQNIGRLRSYSPPINREAEEANQSGLENKVGGDPVIGKTGLENPFFAPSLLAGLYAIFMKLAKTLNEALATESKMSSKLIGSVIGLGKEIKKTLEAAAQKRFIGGMARATGMFVSAAAQGAGAVKGLQATAKAKAPIENEIGTKNAELQSMQKNEMTVDYSQKLQNKELADTRMQEFNTKHGLEEGMSLKAQKDKIETLPPPDKAEYAQLKNEQRAAQSEVDFYENDPAKMSAMQQQAIDVGRPLQPDQKTMIKQHGEQLNKDYSREGGYKQALESKRAEIESLEKFKSFRMAHEGSMAARPTMDAFQAAGGVTQSATSAIDSGFEKEAEMEQALKAQQDAFLQAMTQGASKAGETVGKEYENFSRVVEAMTEISRQNAKLGISYNP